MASCTGGKNSEAPRVHVNRACAAVDRTGSGGYNNIEQKLATSDEILCMIVCVRVCLCARV